MCHGKLGIDFDRTLQQGHGGRWIRGKIDLESGAVEFQGFKRRRGGLGKGSLKLFDGGERFA